LFAALTVLFQRASTLISRYLTMSLSNFILHCSNLSMYHIQRCKHTRRSDADGAYAEISIISINVLYRRHLRRSLIAERVNTTSRNATISVYR